MQQEAVTTLGGETAGFGPRFVAMLIDVVILFVAQMIIRILLGAVLGSLAGLVIGLGYMLYFWTSSGATPGKMAMGLKVVSAETGALLDPGTALLRYVGYIVSGIPLWLGFLWVLWDPEKEAWHDKIAKTRVIKAK